MSKQGVPVRAIKQDLQLACHRVKKKWQDLYIGAFTCHYGAQNHLDEEDPAKPKPKLTPAPLNVEFLLEMFVLLNWNLSVLVFFFSFFFFKSFPFSPQIPRMRIRLGSMEFNSSVMTSIWIRPASVFWLWHGNSVQQPSVNSARKSSLMAWQSWGGLWHNFFI